MRIILKLALTLLVVVSILKDCYSQNYNFEPLGIEDGLSQSTVQCMVRDHHGFMWVGTQDGLNRYDGYAFTILRHSKKDSTSIIDNTITALCVSSDSSLWIGTRAGLSQYIHERKGFVNYRHTLGDSSALTDNDITAIYEDKKGFIWIGTSQGLNRYDPVKNEFKRYLRQNFEFLPSNSISSIFEDGKDRLWVGTREGLVVLDKDRKFLHLFQNEKESENPQLPSSNVTFVTQLENGQIWVISGGSPCLFKEGEMSFQRLAVSFTVNGIYLSPHSKDVIAIGLNGNIAHIHPDLTFSRWNILEKQGLEAGNLNGLIVDPSGLLWIGSENIGILKHDFQAQRFNVFKKEANKAMTLTNPVVWSMIKDRRGNIWVGTDNGLNFINAKTNEVEWTYPSNSSVNAVYEHTNGDIFFAAFGGILRVPFDTDPSKFKVTTPTLSGDIPDNIILSFREDGYGNVVIGTFSGLFILEISNTDPSKLNIKGYFANPEDSKALADHLCWGTYIDKNNTLWVGTEGGLHKANRKGSSEIIDFERFYYDPSKKNSLSHDHIRSITEDSKGMLWIGTPNGLNRFDPKLGEAFAVGEKHDLANLSIYTVLCDAEDKLWMSTNNGILTYDIKTDQFVLYDVRDGLQSNEFNSNAYFRASDGEFFFGGISGFNHFYPNEIKPNSFVPTVLIEDFKLFNESVPLRSPEYPNSPLTKDIAHTDYIELDHTQDIFSFDFVALNFRLPEKNQYRYILENFEVKWNNVGNRRFATYTNVPPGEYIFRVQAANNDGIWNEVGASVIISIKPPIYKTKSFIVISVILVLGSAFFLYSSRINRIKKQKATLQILVEKRTREIAEKSSALELQKTELERSYDNVKIISEIGQKITAILDIDMIISTVYEKVNQLMDATSFGIGIYNEELARIEFRGFIEDGRRLPDNYDTMDEEGALSVWAVKNRAEIHINDFDLEHSQYVPQSIKIPVGAKPESLIYLPLMIENLIVGVLTVQSHKKNAYKDNDITLLRTLASYVSIALDNANAYKHLEDANEIIKNKNTSILDSIRYAETIQQAILPDNQKFLEYFSDFFVMFKPRDLVSGDFYWASENPNGDFFAAVVDCTGHGVPGAFMSMIGNTMLNEIVNVKDIYEPARILEILHDSVRTELKQQDQQNSDGMDLCLCKISKISETQRKVVFSGAKRPLFILYRNRGELVEIKGTKKSIGGFQKEDHRRFEQVELTLQKGDVLYLTTDGYVDQNDPHRNKLGTLEFKQMLEHELLNQPLSQHKALLDQRLVQHMKNEEQRDDITILALEI